MGDFMTSIFDSVKIIVNSELQQLGYDKTIICKIVDNSRCKNGEYKVQDGNAIYTAYSDVQTYRVGDGVRVTIPNGDYTQKKFIDGKCTSDELNTPITYIPFTDNVVNISGNLLTQQESETVSGIIMNGPQLNKIIWNKMFEEKELEHLQTSEIYNTLLLKVDFQTFMKGYDIASGTYGIQIDLLIRPEGFQKECVKKSVQLSNLDMFGDPYAFDIFTTQNKIFALSLTDGTIVGIEVSLFQKGDFKTLAGELLEYPLKQGSDTEREYPEFNHILVKNIEVSFGSNITDIGDNILSIYTPNSLTYRYNNHIPDSNLKKLGLIWYNKNENNQYLGFSDGAYDINYDEAEYLKISEKDTRLTAQIGKTGIPDDQLGLTLAADITEIERFTNQAIGLLTRDLKTQLQNLNVQIGSLAVYDIVTEDGVTSVKKDYKPPDGVTVEKFKINDELLTLINNSADGLDAMTNLILSNPTIESGEAYYGLKEKKNYYYKLLQRISEKKDYEKVDDRNKDKNDLESGIYNLNTIKAQIQTICDKVATKETAKYNFSGVLKNLYDNLKKYFPGYMDTFDIYFIRVKRILNKIDEVLALFPEVIVNKAYLFYVFDNPTEAEIEEQKDIKLEPYEAMDLSYYSNKYCVYWYKYEKGYHSSKLSQFLGDDWKLLEKKVKAKIETEDGTWEEGEITLPSIGIPKGPYYEDENGYFYVDKKQLILPLSEDLEIPVKNPVFCDSSESFMEEYMQFNTTEQKFKAVLFYNHEMFTSNELVFTNTEDIPDETTLDKADGVAIEHIAESCDTYNLYKENHYLLDSSQEYVFREIRCHFEGLTAKDEDILPEASVYWYIPETSMLKYDASYLKDRGFITDDGITDEDEMPNYHREGYTCFYKQIWYDSELEDVDEDKKYIDEKAVDSRSFWYQIRGYYEPSAGNNFIICKIVPAAGETEYEMRFYFNFGFVGTNGTSYTLAINNRDACKAVQSDESLTLKIDLRDANYKKIEVNTSELEISQSDSWIFRTSANLLIQGYDEAIPGMYPDEIRCYCQTSGDALSDDLTGCGIFQIKLTDYEMEPATEDGEPAKTITLSQIHAVPWSSGDYYISGTTQIIYNSLGALDKGSSFDIPYRLYNIGDGSEVNVSKEEGKVKRVSWRVKPYTVSISGGKLSCSEYDTTDDGDPYKTFIPTIVKKTVLEVVDGKDVEGKSIQTVEKKEYGNYNLLTPASMFLSNFGKDLFVVVEAYDIETNDEGENVEVIYWKQPLIIMQNRYESPMLNEWDGGFQINEKNSTVLGAMLGAGYKDPTTNTFNGILMGDLAVTEYEETNTESKDKDGKTIYPLTKDALTGLYGFHNGVKSFGFRIDGTAFIGTPGAGRLEFDGEKGIIQSGNYKKASIDMGTGTETPGSGMQINLATGAIDAYNFKLTSERITLSSGGDPAYFDIKGFDKKKSLIYIADNQYYLQSADYDESYIIDKTITGLNPTEGSSHQQQKFTLQFPKGSKIDLGTGNIYSYQGITKIENEGEEDETEVTKTGLVINQQGFGGVVLAVGDSFYIDSSGSVMARGNWEFWGNSTGTVGISQDGVYSGRDFTDTGGWVDTIAYKWTSWEEMAGVARSFMKQNLFNTASILADVLEILGGGLSLGVLQTEILALAAIIAFLHFGETGGNIILGILESVTGKGDGGLGELPDVGDDLL